ncbi:hypothetical protein [Actinomadura hibisca]|uniref:hypothetical protein n=1 Tax=Actinomadura hibisca TaxID=68565 RepID=UPI0008354D22|nr:hypothetical protein [Actinomadura hibisca]
MTSRGVILYGPPTSGKDTVTVALSALDSRFTLLTKLKVGSGRSTGYRYVAPEELQALCNAGRLAVETERYGNRYAVDRQDIADLVEAGRVPVVHMGSFADMRSLAEAIPLEWRKVVLWVPRQVCTERSQQRGDIDTPARLRAWDEADDEQRRERGSGTVLPADLVIRTDLIEVTEAARDIIEAVDATPTC